MPASIFNDVIGPVMRGPSSSHVAGASRIAEIVRQSLGGDVRRVAVDFDINGSLAESHDGHGTDMGFASGILGMAVTDPDVRRAESIARERGVEVLFNVCDYGATHPNNYRIYAEGGGGRSHTWEAVSVGGGMIEMRKYDGFDVRIGGGFHELLATLKGSEPDVVSTVHSVEKIFPKHAGLTVVKGGAEDRVLLSLKFEGALSEQSAGELRSLPFVTDVTLLAPILPTPSRSACEVPFVDAVGMLAFAEAEGLEMWQLAAAYESARGGKSGEEVFEHMRSLLRIMRECARQGLAGTEYRDRILGPQAHRVEEAASRSALLPCDLLNSVIKHVTAIMEVKSSMGVIVAAPTAGSCGCLPGTIIGVGEVLKLPEDELVKAMLAAGLIGVLIAESATFAAEVAGCQVECGAGSGMAAAAVAQIMGGTPRQCADAASMALQNITGLACDPVANRVEVPCLGKNVMGASNALASANMALAGYDAVIPLDQTIGAVYDIGTKLPLELRCTFGGLGKTEASLAIRRKLEAR